MKLKRIACLTGLVVLSAWSVAACSDDTTTSPGTDGGDEETGGSAGAGGKGAGGASGSAGKGGASGGGGTAGKGGTSGSAGKGGTAGSAGDSGTNPSDGGDPSIKITDPKNLESISKDAEYTMFPKIPVEFTIANFVLKAPGSANCPAGACGHVHINVDGNACNDSGGFYNAAAIASPGIIDLGLCTGGVAGAHTVTASLHNNDHSNVALTDGGPAVSDTITITAVVGDGGSPDAGDGG